MDFALNDEQLSFRKEIVQFAESRLKDDVIAREKKGEFFREGWRRCAEFGIQGMPIAADYGGLELDVFSCVLAMEGLGYACRDAGLLFALNSHLWTCEMPLLKFGSAAQKERYLPRLVRGEWIGGHAMTEPGSGSDAFGMRCRARRDGNRYFLNGSKTFITNAPIADLLLVFALTGTGKGFAATSVFLVERDFPGITFGKPLEMMGLRTCPLGEVFFDDCEIPAENLLGREGGGAAIFNSEMDWERSCLFATHVGRMERKLGECAEYARSREQFGRAIGSNQAVSAKIAEMAMRLELSRLILYKVAWMKGQGQRALRESAMAKLFVSESYLHNCLEAVQIHGAYGYSAEYDYERYLRDAVGGRIYSGTSEIQRNIIASTYGL
jgi:alkylation response protein AidB-like acyl-CoA dehydrogenase